VQYLHEVDSKFLDSDFLSNTAMILLKKRMIQVAIESPNKVNELAMLARIVVANESVGVKKYWVERDQERHTDELEEKLAKAKLEKAT